MYRKIVLLLAALALTVCSHLRPRLSLYVDGQRVPGTYSAREADRARLAAERAAEEILPGNAEFAREERRWRLSLRAPDGSAAGYTDALLRSAEGITVNDAVYVGGEYLGNVEDREAFLDGLHSYIRNTLPTWAASGSLCREVEFCRQYSRCGSETKQDDMSLVVTGMAPVLYSDGRGYVSRA